MSVAPKISACLSNGCKTMTVDDTTGVYSLINLYGWGYPNEVKTDVLSGTLQILAPGQTTYTTIDVTTAITGSNPLSEEFLLSQISYSDIGLTTNFTDGIYEFIYTISGINTYAEPLPIDTGYVVFSNKVQNCVSGDIELTFDIYNDTPGIIDAITFSLPNNVFYTIATPGFNPGVTQVGLVLTFLAGTYTPGVPFSIPYVALDTTFLELTYGNFYISPIFGCSGDPTFEYVYKTTKAFVCNARCCVDQQIGSLTNTFNANCGCCENREKVKDLQLADILITSIEEGGDCMDADKLASHLAVLAKICRGKNCCN